MTFLFKILPRLVRYFACVLTCVLFLEAIWFSYVLIHKASDAPSDTILVFMGSEKRIETGYKLANQGLAPRMVLSSSTDTLRHYYDRTCAVKDAVVHIPEDQAVNTFENALYTSRIIEANRYKTVTLVTSDYHMPRSLALLRLLLMGKDVRVHIHKVSGSGESVNAALLKLVYNEMIKLWGSLFEYVTYQVRGLPAEKPVKKSAISYYLRSLLLLDVEPSW